MQLRVSDTQPSRTVLAGISCIDYACCVRIVIFAWGVIMKRIEFLLAATVVCLAISASGAEAVCKKSFYTGSDRDPIWWEGRNNARADWSDKVRGHIGSKWSKWSKAKNANDTCDWLPTQGVNYCVARAKPCK